MKKLTAKKYLTDIVGAELNNICSFYIHNGGVSELNLLKLLEGYAEAKLKEKIKK